MVGLPHCSSPGWTVRLFLQAHISARRRKPTRDVCLWAPKADVVASRDLHCVGTVLSPMVEQSRAKVSSYAIRGWGLSRRFLLCESCFQPRDVFQEALAGQEEQVIAELRILKVDFKQPFISYGQDLATTCLMALLPMYSRLPVGG